MLRILNTLQLNISLVFCILLLKIIIIRLIIIKAGYLIEIISNL